MDFFNCVPLSEAVVLVRAKTAGLKADFELVGLPDALGRIVAEDVIMKEDLPPFNRSTVDGFAVRSSDTFGAGEGIPALLDIVDEVFMGKPALVAIQPGQAAIIPTGGMLPEGADAVVMLEHTERPDGDTVLVLRSVVPGENIISRGEDAAAGGVILRQGRRILPQDIGVLAACGYAKVPVRMKPKVGIISTGDELVDVGCVPEMGQIINVNSYALAAMLETAGCEVKRFGIVPDRYEELLSVLSQAVASCQMVLVSGGSSVGARDYTVKAIGALGEPGVLLHGVAIRPGKPTIFGMVGQVPVFGLPGHPVSAMVICEQMVKPVIAAMLDRQSEGRVYKIPARIARSVASTPGRDDFLRVKLDYRDGQYFAEPVFGKAGLIKTMVQSDGIVHIPADKSGLYDGEFVEVTLFHRQC